MLKSEWMNEREGVFTIIRHNGGNGLCVDHGHGWSHSMAHGIQEMCPLMCLEQVYI